MNIYDKIRVICGLIITEKDEDGLFEFIGTDKQRKKADEMIEKYEDGELDEDEIEETWKELQTELPEDKINLYH